MTVLALPFRLQARAARWLDRLQPAAGLAMRLYVAHDFFRSGLTKISHWQITLALFEDEYHVPVLPPAWAAVLGTGAELALPVLLALGLGTRFAAAALFAFNVVAVVSYPELSDAGLKDHVLWGTLLALLVVYGGGRASVDALLEKRFA